MGVLLSGRQRLISGVVAILALAMTGEAFAQSSSCPADLTRELRRTGGRVVANVSNSPVSLITGQIADGDAATVSQIRATCQRELRSGQGNAHNLEAYMCVGRATDKLAELDSANRDSGYRCAVEVYRATAEHARRGGISQTRGDAHAARAQSLMNLRNLYSAQTEAAAELLTQAINAYNDAIAANPSDPERRFAVGRAYLTVGQIERAAEQIREGQRLAPTGDTTAMALVSLAEALSARGAQPAEVLTYLQSAQNAAQNSVAANAALGRAYLAMGDLRSARSALERAVGPGSVDSAGGTNYRDAANYHLSLIAAQDAMTAPQWQRVIEFAEAAGDTDLRYRALECLGHVGRGGASVRSTNSRNRLENPPGLRACNNIGSSPEAELLRGMFFMREAQHFNIGVRVSQQTPERNAYREAVGAAAAAFNRGVTAAARLPEGGTANWPSLPRTSMTNSQLLQLLEFGARVLSYECAGAPQQVFDSEVRRRGFEFFGRYGLRGCNLSQEEQRPYQ